MLPTLKTTAFVGGVLSLAALGAILGWNRPQWPERPTYLDREIPESGLVLNPEGANNPGDPKEAVKDLGIVYKGLKAYIARHGKFPMPGELAGSDEKPGLVARDAFKVPDIDLSDYGSAKDPNSTYAFAYRAPRFDDSPKPIAPSNGDRDVWMYTDVYVRRNETVFRDGSKTTQPTGVYVVLWSDGKIKYIDPLDVVWTGRDGSMIMRFPGEPGTQGDALTQRKRLQEAPGTRLIERS